MPNSGSTILAFGQKSPHIHPSVFLAEGTRIVGDVTIGEDSSVWFNAVVRGDVHWVRIGQGVNIQDNAVLHVTHDTAPLQVDDHVTIGHSAVVHGCTVHAGSLIGMRAVLLDGAVVGARSLVAAGSVVRERMMIPEGVLVAGNPATVKRDLSEVEQANLLDSSRRYSAYARTYNQIYQGR